MARKRPRERAPAQNCSTKYISREVEHVDSKTSLRPARISSRSEVINVNADLASGYFGRFFADSYAACSRANLVWTFYLAALPPSLIREAPVVFH